MLAGHHRAAQIHGHDAIECLGGYLSDRGVASGNADAHVVVKHVDPIPPAHAVGDGGFETGFVGHIRPARGRRSARLANQPCGLLGRVQVPVDRQHPGALAGEQQGRGAPVAHRRPGRLPGTDDDRNLSLQSHHSLRRLDQFMRATALAGAPRAPATRRIGAA